MGVPKIPIVLAGTLAVVKTGVFQALELSDEAAVVREQSVIGAAEGDDLREFRSRLHRVRGQNEEIVAVICQKMLSIHDKYCIDIYQEDKEEIVIAILVALQHMIRDRSTSVSSGSSSSSSSSGS